MSHNKKKKKAHVFHQVHWDPEWYFTEQDTTVSFAYNMRELLAALDSNRIDKFFIDGRTDCVEDYLISHQEDIPKFTKYVEEGRLMLGPLHAQLDCMISSGEAIYNNLRIGMELANKYGGTYKIAYLPDSFGHNQDFPKIFNDFGIKDFVFRRGLGDEHGLPIDFYWKSNDGSEVLCNALQGGYGFATDAFVDGTMTSDAGVNYEGFNLLDEFRKLNNWSTLDDEFLLPIGFDLNPAIVDFSEKIEMYNNDSDEFEFYETTLHEFMEYLRENGKDIPTYQGELMSAQYHRIHRSLYSARTDIKVIQDKIERVLTFEVQPLMTMLDRVGVPYDKGLIDRAWDLCLRSQTHSSATNTDKTNEVIKDRSLRSLNIAEACKVYLIRKVAESFEKTEKRMPLVLFNTLAYKRDYNYKINVYSKSKDFKLELDGKEVEYAIVDCEEGFKGMYRRDCRLMDKEDYFFKTTVAVNIKDFEGLSYKVLYVVDGDKPKAKLTNNVNVKEIENSRFKVTFRNGKFDIFDKKMNKLHKDALYIEESGDQGDNYDFDYPNPEDDMKIISDFSTASIVSSFSNAHMGEIVIEGLLRVPYNLEERKLKKLTTDIPYRIAIRLNEASDMIDLKGYFDNKALNHRIRLVLRTENESEYAYAGTQFSYIKRETLPSTLAFWKERNWLEEPTPIEPLINHVSLVGDEYTASMFTRSIKEYEIIGDGFKDIAFTIFRAVGHLGLPDLNRRPGRASGLKQKLFETPLSQVQFKNTFEFGFTFYEKYDGNKIGKDYVEYATDQAYFQFQRLERAVFPMSFLDTDPIEGGVPKQFHMFTLEDSEAVLSTVYKAADNSGAIVRIFNNENHDVNGGRLNISIVHSGLELVDALERKISECTQELGIIPAGGIRNIKINF